MYQSIHAHVCQSFLNVCTAEAPVASHKDHKAAKKVEVCFSQYDVVYFASHILIHVNSTQTIVRKTFDRITLKRILSGLILSKIL